MRFDEFCALEEAAIEVDDVFHSEGLELRRGHPKPVAVRFDPQLRLSI